MNKNIKLLSIQSDENNDIVFITNEGKKYIKCNYLFCFAGTGVAGNGHCFLGGCPWDKNCDKFIDEDEAINEYRKKYIQESGLQTVD